MAELLEAVWVAGIDTQFSCQDWPHPGYIVFPTIGDAVRFLQATSERTEHHDSSRLMMSPRRNPPAATPAEPDISRKMAAPDDSRS